MIKSKQFITTLMLILFFYHTLVLSYQAKPINFPKMLNQCFSCKTMLYPVLNYQVYGGFVKVYGNKIWVEKYGRGSPAVILLNGGGETIRQWNSNIPEIEKYTTVIAYDRLGLGLSENGNYQPRTAAAIVQRLQIILHKIKVKPPYILVAHSIGGLYLSYFARKYPKQIAGLVTIDANNRYQVDLYQANINGVPGFTKAKIRTIMQHPQHLLAVTKQAHVFLKQKHLTKHQHAKLIEDLEVMGKLESAKQLEKLGGLPQVPLIALTEGSGPDYALWHATIKQFADEVPCSIYQWVPHSGHHIMIDQPKIVNHTIKKVVLAARNHHSFCSA